MDQFDDLPDFVEKDSKPKFMTEVHKPSNQDQQVSNGLKPLFEDEPTQAELYQVMASNKDDQGNQDGAKQEDKQISHANGNVED